MMKQNPTIRDKKVFQRIREIRKEQGYSQEEIAELSGLAQPTISRIESGRGGVRVKTLEKITKILGFSLKINKKM